MGFTIPISISDSETLNQEDQIREEDLENGSRKQAEIKVCEKE